MTDSTDNVISFPARGVLAHPSMGLPDDQPTTALTFDQWLTIGMDSGWVGPPVCETHDGTPMSLDEETIFDEGDDPCISVLRLYDDADHKVAVESHHAPSVWRKVPYIND